MGISAANESKYRTAGRFPSAQHSCRIVRPKKSFVLMFQRETSSDRWRGVIVLPKGTSDIKSRSMIMRSLCPSCCGGTTMPSLSTIAPPGRGGAASP